MDELNLIAYHEAGHVVAAVLLGKPPTYASIVPGEGYSGITKGIDFFEEGYDLETFCLFRIDDFQTLKKFVIADLAGEVAQSIYSGIRDPIHSSYDNQHTYELLIHFDLNMKLIDAIVDEADAYLHEIFKYRDVKELLETYFNELISRKELNSEDIKQIFEDSMCYESLHIIDLLNSKKKLDYK